MPQKIIIVRHGETQWNVEHRLQGWTDIPLNDNGLSQAAKVAERLQSETISFIYSSDHQRAHSTAHAIGIKHSLIPIKCKELREDGMGVLEGWTWEDEIDQQKQSIWLARDAAHAKGDMDWKVDGGESLREHTARVKELVCQIESRHLDGTIAIVTHGGTINRLMEIYGFKKITDEYISYKNTSVTILTKSTKGYELTVDNDISHLDFSK